MVAAVIVNTENENPDACIAVVVKFEIMKGGRTDVLNAMMSLASLRDARNTVANSPVRALWGII